MFLKRILRWRRRLVPLLAFGLSTVAADAARAVDWQVLEPGLELATPVAPHPAAEGDSQIWLLRLDPQRFDLQLLNSSARTDGARRSARGWAEEGSFVAVTNAGMYQADYRTSLSLMQRRDHVNNPRLTKDRTVLAFDPLDGGVPSAQIIDRSCQDFDALRPRYAGLVQSIRMISCRRENVWRQQEQRWSISSIAMDDAGRLVLIHARSPFSTHDLIENLLELPLGLTRAMYLEGGAQAQLYVHAGGREIERVGSRGSRGLGGNMMALPIPNALAVRRRAAAP
jgi:hypothetical protein